MRKIISLIICLTLSIGMFSNPVGADTATGTDNVVNKKVNVGVDFNGPENRADCKHPIFEDWVVATECQESTYVYEEGGLTFTVKNATKDGKGAIITSENKKLVNATGVTPFLTLDGLRCTQFKNTAISLEISGLPAGTHTITSWHSLHWINPKDSSISVSVNGEVVNSGILLPSMVKDDNLAAITYNSFEVVEGEPVVITFATEGTSKMYNVTVLNAFEIDGVHPLKAIKNAYPEDGDKHFESSNGFSWTPADGATSHMVYVGDDEYTVSNATTDYPEYKGEVTENTFDLSEIDFDHMKTYYWRVDEVFEDGSVITGKVYSFNVAHLAFPTAEGYGRFAHGGRGGRIIEVTNLEDGYEIVLDESGNPLLDENGSEIKQPIEGSLRWAIESFTGPRIVVFNVGGAINLVDKLTIDGEHGDIYIAGQTAPGSGITLNNYTFGAMGAEDVIIRNVRVRIGDVCNQSMGGMGLGGCDYSIIDHCSISWATDEGFSSRNAKNITLQRTIIAESLNNSVHYAPSEDGSTENRDPNATSPHGFAASIGGNKATFHHNLLTNCTARNWSQAGGLESDGSYAGYLDIRYNLVYNWKYRTCEGGARQTNFVGNYYKMGPESRDVNIYQVEGDEVGNSYVDPETGERKGNWQMAYLEGNKMVDTEGNVLLDPVNDDPWKRATLVGLNMTTPEDCVSYEPFFPSYVAESTADEAYESILSDVGAIAPEWDYLDSRYVNEAANGTYTYVGSKDGFKGIIDSQTDVGGYPNEDSLEYATREADFDTDHDGMPNEWENLHGLDPENSSDGNVITLSADGYTNVEMYLNELMGDPLEWINDDQKPTPTEAPTPVPTETPEITATPELTDTPAPDYLLGDVNKDGEINAADALAVLKHAAKIEILEGDYFLAADVNKDESADAKDALEILKLAAKIIDSFN